VHLACLPVFVLQIHSPIKTQPKHQKRKGKEKKKARLSVDKVRPSHKNQANKNQYRDIAKQRKVKKRKKNKKGKREYSCQIMTSNILRRRS